MPSSTPAPVVSQMESDGKNVALLPSGSTTPGVSIVSRSYWSFSNYGLGDYDRFGYHGPTDTLVPTISAFLTDTKTGELTSTPVSDCGAQSQVPKKAWYDPATNSPIVTFKNAPRPTQRDLSDIPHWMMQTGSVMGSMGAEFAPSPVADQVQFYRNVANSSPYADVQAAPPPSNPPDACGGYVVANLPNDVVSLVHIPKLPTFPDYTGADASTTNSSDDYQVQFYSIVIYGETKQVDALGSPNNSQLGNSQIEVAPDGSVTVVLWPQSATPAQVAKIDAARAGTGQRLSCPAAGGLP